MDVFPHYPHIVTEYYPDGGTWTHWHTSREDAEYSVEVMQEAHKGRKYEIKAWEAPIRDKEK